MKRPITNAALDGRLLTLTPVDPIFLLVPILRAVFTTDVSTICSYPAFILILLFSSTPLYRHQIQRLTDTVQWTTYLKKRA